ncbi:MAG TPA: hypothetical protein VGD98_12235 [Ktedonobacteraceae bacterium]
MQKREPKDEKADELIVHLASKMRKVPSISTLDLSLSYLEISKSGTFVEQDGLKEHDKVGQVYYYIGEGLAYTERVRTCTALAIYKKVPGQLAYLSHADSSTSSKVIATHIGEYLTKVGAAFFDPAQTSIVLCFAEDTFSGFKQSVLSSSLTPVLKGLLEVIGAERARAMCATICYQEVGPQDKIVVGNGHAPSAFPATREEMCAWIISLYLGEQDGSLRQDELGSKLVTFLPSIDNTSHEQREWLLSSKVKDLPKVARLAQSKSGGQKYLTDRIQQLYTAHGLQALLEDK